MTRRARPRGGGEGGERKNDKAFVAMDSSRMDVDTQALYDDMMAALHKTTVVTSNRYYSTWDVRLDQGRLGTYWMSLYYYTSHYNTTAMNNKSSSSSRKRAHSKMHLRDLREEILQVYDQDIPPPHVSRHPTWHYQYYHNHKKNEFLSLYSSSVMGTYCLLIHIESLLDQQQQQYPTKKTPTVRRRSRSTTTTNTPHPRPSRQQQQRSQQHSTTVKRLLQELQSRLYDNTTSGSSGSGSVGMLAGIFYLRHVLRAPKLFASHVVQHGLSILRLLQDQQQFSMTTTKTTPPPQHHHPQKKCWNAMYVLLGCSKEDWRTMEEKMGVDYPAQLLVQFQQSLDAQLLQLFHSSSSSSSSSASASANNTNLYWEGGTCGVVGVLLRAAQVYQSQDYLRQAWDLCRQIWKQIEKKHDNNAKANAKDDYHYYRGGIGNGVPGIAMTFWMFQQYCTDNNTKRLWQNRARTLLQRCMREWNNSSIFSTPSSKSPLASSSPSRQSQAWFGLWDGLGGLLSVLMYCQQQQGDNGNEGHDDIDFPLFPSSRQPQDQVPIRLDLSTTTVEELNDKKSVPPHAVGTDELADNLEIMDSPCGTTEEIEEATAAPDTATRQQQAPQVRLASTRATAQRTSDTSSSLRVDTTTTVTDLPTITRRRRRRRPPINTIFDDASAPTPRRPQRSPGVRLTRAAQLRMQESKRHHRISPHSRLTPKATSGESSDTSTAPIPRDVAAVEDRRRKVQAQQDAKRRKSMDSRRHRQEQELQKRRELQLKREAKQAERRAQIQEADKARQEAVRLQKQQVLQANRERVLKLARERAQRREQLQQHHTEAQARIRIKTQNEQARLARAKAIREQLEGVSSSMAVVNENISDNNVTRRDANRDISSCLRSRPSKTVARTMGPTKKHQHQEEKMAKVQKSKKAQQERLERKRHDDQRRIETVQAQILSKKLTKLLQQEQQEQAGDDGSPKHLDEAVPESKTATNDDSTKEQVASSMSCKEIPVAKDEPNSEDLVADKSVVDDLVAGASSTVKIDADNSIDDQGTSIKSKEASFTQDIPDPSFSADIPSEDDWAAVGSTLKMDVESILDEQGTSIKSNETGPSRQVANAVLGGDIKTDTTQDLTTPNVEPLHVVDTSPMGAQAPRQSVATSTSQAGDIGSAISDEIEAQANESILPTMPEVKLNMVTVDPLADGGSGVKDEEILSCTKESNQDGEMGSSNIGNLSNEVEQDMTVAPITNVSNEVEQGMTVAPVTMNDGNVNDKIDIPPTGILNPVHLDMPSTEELVEDESFAQNDEDRSSARPSLVADLSLTNDKEFESVNAMFAQAENILESQLEDIFGYSSAGDDPASSPTPPTNADIASKATPSMELASDSLVAAAVAVNPSTGTKEEIVPGAADSLDVSSVHAMEASNDNQEKLQGDERSTTFEETEDVASSANKGPEKEYVSAGMLQIADFSTIVSDGSNTTEMHKRKIEGTHDTEAEMPVDLDTSASAQSRIQESNRIQEGHDGQNPTIQRVHSKESNITENALSENILLDTFDSIDGEEGGFVVVDEVNKAILGGGIAETSLQIAPQEESAVTAGSLPSIPSPDTASCKLSKVESSSHGGAGSPTDAKGNAINEDIAGVDDNDNEDKEEEEDSDTSDGFGRMDSLFAQADQDLQAELASILGTPEAKPDSSTTALSPLDDFDDNQELLDSIVEEDAGLTLLATHKATASTSAELVPESSGASLRRRRSRKVAPADKK